MRIRLSFVPLGALLTLAVCGAGLAQTPAPPAPAPSGASGPTYVLVPYQAPESKDEHAPADTNDLSADLSAAGISATMSAPMPHLEAVAHASKLCEENHAAALLVPDGRSEQTMKRVPVPFLGSVVHYPTHVEFRLDEIGCDGVVVWSTIATGDQSPGGLDSAGNLGAAVDAAFRSAIQDAVQTFAAASSAQHLPAVAAASAAPRPIAAPAAPANYVLLPIAQPKLADPRANDITQSLLAHLENYSLKVTLASAPIDHLTAIASAPTLCSSYGAQAIIVPDIRIEQSSYSGRSYASLHLTQLACNGTVMNSGSGSADMGSGFINNFGAAAVGVSERAMNPAIEAMLGKAPAVAPSATPAAH